MHLGSPGACSRSFDATRRRRLHHPEEMALAQAARDKSLRKEEGPMSKDIKTLAIRLDGDLHARLAILARLRGESVTDLIRQAVESRLDDLAHDPALAAKAKQLQDEIEREANEQKGALAALFPSPPAPPSPTRTKASS